MKFSRWKTLMVIFLLYCIYPVAFICSQIGSNFPAYQVNLTTVVAAFAMTMIPFAMGYHLGLNKPSPEEDPLEAESWRKKK